MNRLFGILIISLTLLTCGIIWQLPTSPGLSEGTIILVGITLLIGFSLAIPGDETENREESYLSDEEIEKELEENLK
ncbi:hypothetical protein SAMN04487944_12836 [Gracilibacillus ureilyticus]|uniref:Uncharacterized protein n=1 Tax=Gracilibacillus ureilyticus TaxID=531814 RepID=A0A1H9VVP8_9BACI|nr:hypothetical protein [Gracilibacillus ureilyticus]SES25735.1 hypothetical protein SAMN04487944_12836 [Gracilibacillus ureilyticus]